MACTLLPVLLLAAASWTPLTAAQTILTYGSGGLPTCAEQCTILQTAQEGCVPPAAPVTDQAIYDSCFCQSGYISSLRSDASQYCGSVCSGSDLTDISTWYTNFCASDNSAATNQGTTTTAAAAQTTTTAADGSQQTTMTTTASAATSTSTSSSTSSNSSSNSAPQTWWQGHWRWVLMLIIIAAGMSLLAWATIFFRKRHRRNRDAAHGRFNDGVTSRSMVQVNQPIMARSVSGLSQTAGGDSGSDESRGRTAYLKSKLSRTRISEEV